MTMNVPTMSIAEMREIDDRAVKHFGIETVQLMELAGYQIARFANEKMSGVKGKHIIALVGKGHNGGDALVAAKHLVNWGAKVTVIIAAHPDQLKPLVKDHVGTLKSMFVRIFYQVDTMALDPVFRNAQLILDGLLGYHITEDPKGFYGTLIEMANSSGKKILAIDNPSGINCDTGEPLHPCIKAKWTLSLILPKKGLVEKRAKDYVGEYFVADIGIPTEVFEVLGMNHIEKIFAKNGIVKVK